MLPRQWIFNLLNSVLGEEFSDWIKARLEERNAQFMAAANVELEMDPKMFAAFEQSTLVSSKHTMFR